jgi:hypothetical protein
MDIGENNVLGDFPTRLQAPGGLKVARGCSPIQTWILDVTKEDRGLTTFSTKNS